MDANSSSTHQASIFPPVLDLRRIYILPTRHGLLLGALLLVILLGAVNYDNALAYLLCFLLCGLVLVAMLHTYRNLAGLSLGSASAAPVFAGDTACFDLRLVSRIARARCAVRVVYGNERNAALASTVALVETEAIATLRVPTSQRGLLALQRIRIDSVFPLGILRAWAYFQTTAGCVVYPTPRGRLPIPLAPTAAAANALGNAPGTDDFSDLRTYRPGDTLGSVHWPALAKSDTLLVKRFQGGGDGEVWLRWRDLTAVHDDEARLSQLARWVLEAEQAGLRYGLELPNATLPVARGATHRAAVLRALALYRVP